MSDEEKEYRFTPGAKCGWCGHQKIEHKLDPENGNFNECHHGQCDCPGYC